MKVRFTQIEVDEMGAAEGLELLRGAMALRSLPGPVGVEPTPLAIEAPAVVPAVPAARAAAPAARKPGRKAAAAEALPAPDSTAGRVLDALKKKPMSSIELQAALKIEPQPVYQAASALKNKGLIDSRTDDAGDGTRRYFYIGK